MTLRARLFLAALYVLLVVVVGLEVPLATSIARSKTREFESGILTNTSLLAARVNDDVPLAGTDPTRAPEPPTSIDRLARQTAAEVGVPSLRFVITDRLGRVLADSAGEAAVGEVYMTPSRPEFAHALRTTGNPIYRSVRHSETLGEDLLVVAVPVVHNREPVGVARATVPLGTVQSAVRRIWLGLGAIGLLAIVVGLAATWFLATSVIRPVRRLEDAAVQLGSGDLEARADPAGPREVATLARAFNQMAAVLAANMAAQRDFLANASHQLRTPLTGLRLRLEAIRAEGGPPAEQAARAEQEVERLAKLVDDLLMLARAASAESTGSRLDLADAARTAADRWVQPAHDQGKSLTLQSPPAAASAFAFADPTDVGHILDNLIENAIRYTPSGARITVRAGSRDGRAYLEVADDGPGIPAADAGRIFERFYRGSTGRQAGPGTGLGLAIAAQLARRWGGDLELQNGRGATFVASFPAEPAVS
ncbi:MAG: ATP-binding protein [Actinomycetota bacterium]